MLKGEIALGQVIFDATIESQNRVQSNNEADNGYIGQNLVRDKFFVSRRLLEVRAEINSLIK
jgi:hypothetical protein